MPCPISRMVAPNRRSGIPALPKLSAIGVIIVGMRKSAGALLGLTVSVLAMAMPMEAAAASGPSSQPIKVRVHLEQDRVIAGQPIIGVVVFTNTTRKAITVDQCATDGWLAVGLSGKVDSYPFGHFLIGCPPSVRLHPAPTGSP